LKNLQLENFFVFFDKKIAIYLSLASIDDAQATGEAFSLKIERPALKHEYFTFSIFTFSIFIYHFCPPGS
jgi:hypothetical protein